MSDHDELKRLAEAAKALEPKKSGRLCMKWWNANEAFQAAAYPAVILALLSEIAALRASASVIEPELGDLEATNADLARLVAQAERQRDELRKALEFYAQPIWSIRGEFPEPSPHSEYRPDCGDTARQALASQGAE